MTTHEKARELVKEDNMLIAIDASRIERLEDELRKLRAALDGATIKPRPEWIKISEAAEALGVSTDTIRRKVASGEIDAKGSGKTRRVRL